MSSAAATSPNPTHGHRFAEVAASPLMPRRCSKAGSCNAAAKPADAPKRSAGIRSRALAIAASTFGGTALRCAVIGSSSPTTTFPRIACGVPPVNGGSPAIIS